MDTEKAITSLHDIQRVLKVPKGQKNAFGNYNYRSCEDIVEAVKKVLPADHHLITTDEIVQVGDRIYIKATARLVNCEKTYEAVGWAREPAQKKGMDESQITGATSSYARKYALNGLFCIDDTKDADTNEAKEAEKNRDLTDEEDEKIRDINYLLSRCSHPVDVDSLVDEYASFINDLPEKEAVELDEELQKARSRGGQIENHVYHFKSSTQARKAYHKMINYITTAKDMEKLFNAMTRWDGKLRGLNKPLGKNDEVDGRKPYEHLVYLYNQRNKDKS